MRITDIFDAVRDGTYFDFMDFYSGNPNLFNKYAGMSLLQLSVVNDRYPDEKIKIKKVQLSRILNSFKLDGTVRLLPEKREENRNNGFSSLFIG